MTPEITDAAAGLLDDLRAARMTVATAESCTGGLIAAALTAIAGSSDVVDRGFVTYSNAAKTEMLGVDPGLIAQFGAVSGPVAAAMASGALQRAPVDIAVSVTGVAGPGGGTPDKPVGTVWFGLAVRGRPGLTEQRGMTERLMFPGDRTEVRHATVLHALELFRRALG